MKKTLRIIAQSLAVISVSVGYVLSTGVLPAYAGVTSGGDKEFSSSSYRVYDQSTSTTPGAPIAATNTPGVLGADDAAFRVRMGIDTPSMDVVYVGEAREYGCLLTTTSDVYCWGDNNSGTFGDGTVTNSYSPKKTDFGNSLNGEKITQLSVGYYHVCAVTNAGSVYCWGYNSRGQVGNNTTAQVNSPVKINGFGALAGKTVKQVSAGTETTCALASDDRAYCWGDNQNSQAGYDRNSSLRTLIPVAVDTTGPMSGKDIAQVQTNQYVSCAVDTAGAAYCWGSNYSGGLGSGDPSNYYYQPVAVDMSGVLAGKTINKLMVAQDYVCVIASDSLGYCWGWNSHGMLGDGTNVSPYTPVAVDTSGALAGKTLKEISGTTTHTCAIASDDNAYCWGDNFEGALASNDGTQGEEWSPVAVYRGGLLAGKSVKHVSAHFWSSCFVSTDDRLYCSGDNSTGELGDGTSNPSIQVVGGTRISYDVLAGANAYELQYTEKTAATCEAQNTGFTAVTSASPIAYAQVAGVTNGSAIATDPNDPTPALVTTPQAIYTDPSVIASPATSPEGGSAIWDYSLVDNGAPVGTTYCLRMVYSGGQVLEAYTNVASVTVAGPASAVPPATTSTPTTKLSNTGTTIVGTALLSLALISTACIALRSKKSRHYILRHYSK